MITTSDIDKKKGIMESVRKSLVDLLGQDFSSFEISLLNIEQPFSKSFFALREKYNQIELSRM